MTEVDRNYKCDLCGFLREEHGAMEAGPQYKADHFFVRVERELEDTDLPEDLEQQVEQVILDYGNDAQA